MKMKLPLLILCLLLVLTGCAIELPDDNSNATDNDVDLARIAALEAELQQARADHYIKESALQQEIEDLKSKIAVLTGKHDFPEQTSLRGQPTYDLKRGSPMRIVPFF